jgi:hypothetical protein
VSALWRLPEGVRVLPSGSWQVGGLPVLHAASLRRMKSQLVFEADGAFLDDGQQRLAVQIDGPPFEVVALRLDGATGEARVALDDGSDEAVEADSLAMNPDSGRFESSAREGRARAVFSRAAHQTLIDNLEQDGGTFFLRVGPRRIPIRA